MTLEEANIHFEYKDGHLYRRHDVHGGRVKAGSLVGYTCNGYRKTSLCGKQYLIHRIIFLIHHGYMPSIIDHVDRNTLNNKIENLREATRSENGLNSKKRRSLSKYRGVYYKKSKKYLKRWTTAIVCNGKKITTKCFHTEEEAALMYNKLAVRYHGEFANLNIIPLK